MRASLEAAGSGGGFGDLKSAAPIRHIALTALVVIALAGLCFFTVSRIGGCYAKHAEASGALAATGTQRVDFLAVGDNLPNERLGAWADAQAGTIGDGSYDYSALYAPIESYIQAADLAYCKQETHCGGNDIGPKGYPSFNTTDEMADAIVKAGFDLVASASNHCYDWGSYGASDHSCALWETKDVVYTGTYADEAARNTIATTTVNDITFSLLDYTYGVNGYAQSELPDHVVKFIDESLIRDDVAKAREMSDVVMVAMHWGTENQTEPDELQTEFSQILADCGVDIILGSHPHVIGPLAWLEGKDGNKTLCAYSLGNFVSDHEIPLMDNEIEGMLSCTFIRTAHKAGSDEKDGEVGDTAVATSRRCTDDIEYTVYVDNVVWTPLVNHTTDSDHAVYAVKDYTAELAAAHAFFGSDGTETLAQLRQRSREVVNSLGGDFTIDD